MDPVKYQTLIAEKLAKANLFTNQFGRFTKSDYEILMFSIYLDALEKPARDYEVSVELGIPESKVRSLRIKAQLLYPKDLKWDAELIKALKKADYVSEKRTITIMLEDPSVQNMLKNKIEQAYGIVYRDLNAKLLTLPVESYIILALELENDKEKALKSLNERWKTIQENSEPITKESLVKEVWSKAGLTKLLLGCGAAVWPQGAAILQAVSDLIP